MARKKYWIGSRGPFYFDDATRGVALETDGQLKVDTAPTEAGHVVRKADLSNYAPAGAQYVVIDNNTDLTAERKLAISDPLTKTDGGANSTITLGVDQSKIDHGSIDGLSDDDHSQYSLANGSRAYSGNVTINSPSGTGLTVNSSDTTPDISIVQSGAGLSAQLALTNAARTWYVQGDASPDEFSVRDQTAGADRLTINNAGLVTVKQGLTVDSNVIVNGTAITLQNAGSVALNLTADTDNVTESDQPIINLSQDGGGVTAQIGYAASENVLRIHADNGGGDGQINLMTEAVTRMTVYKDGNIGINEQAPLTLLELTSTVPYITLHNSTNEDISGGRESRIIARGQQSGAEETILGYIEFSHNGTSDDEKGMFRLYLNDGNDGTSPTLRLTVNADGGIVLGTIKSGADQAAAGAAANELWKTAGHATLPDNVVMIGV